MVTPKVYLVAGARPNFVKLAPLVRTLQGGDSGLDWKIVHTGQHYDREMSDVFFEELDIPPPGLSLGVGGGSHAEQTGQIMVCFEKACLEQRPAAVVVVGDVNSTLAASIVAKKIGVRVAHVEAGLRSRDWAMPEEVNRVVTDAISDYLFVTERSGVDNLIAEGKDRQSIHFVGHVMIDNLLFQRDKLLRLDTSNWQSSILKRKYRSYGVVTLHRPSNVDDPKTFANILLALNEISRKLPLVFPVHPRTKQKLQELGARMSESITLTKPLSYLNFLNLWKDAELILTDSGGIQEETTALNVPCLTVRENTERPITVTEGTNILVGTDPDKIRREAEHILSGHVKTGRCPEFWDGKASDRIVDILSRELIAHES